MAQGNPHPNQSGLRPPWRRGENPGTRTSNDAAKAVRLARRLCPEAVQFLGKVMNDAGEAMALRVRAAETLLHHGMPRGDTSKYVNEETIGGITITLVTPKVEEPKAIEGRALTINTVPAGTGD